MAANDFRSHCFFFTCQRQLLPAPRTLAPPQPAAEKTFNSHHHHHHHHHHRSLQIDSTRRRRRTFAATTQPRLAGLLLLLLLFLTASDIRQLAAVKIRHHSISQVVDGGTNFSHLLLDCDYTYDPGDIKLVVRWFFNDAPEPIYQWIPSSDTRYVGELLRPFFDLEHRLGEDRFTKYRAIRLVSRRKSSSSSSSSSSADDNHQNTLPVTLAGKYACLISSINSQDSKHGQLVVFVPPKKFEFSLLTSEEAASFLEAAESGNVLTEESSVNSGPLLRCSVEDVFPRPVLTFSELSTGNGSPVPPPLNNGGPQVFPSVEVATSVNDSSGLFSSSFTYRLPAESIKVGTVYECKLELPGTAQAQSTSSSSFTSTTSSFTRKKRIKLIYPSTYNYPNRAHEQPNADNNNNWFGWSSSSNGRNSNRSPPPSSADYQMHSKTSLSSSSSSSSSAASNSPLKAQCAPFSSCTAAAAFFACLLVHLLWHSWSPCTTADLMR